MDKHPGRAPGDADQRVLFVLPRMVAGGVERATLNLIAGLQQRGIDCRLALGRCQGELLREAMALTVVDEIAGKHRRRWIKGLRRVIADYQPTHVVTAFVDVTLMTVLSLHLARSPAALIVGVHGTWSPAAATGGRRVRLRFARDALLAHLAYRAADALVAVSHGVAGDLRRRYRSASSRVSVIYSPIVDEPMRSRIEALHPRVSVETPRLVVVGRLAFEKGFDVLLQAMPILLAQMDVHLDIYGEGAERLRLIAQAQALGLAHALTFKGATLDPLAAMHEAELFVFPSRNEGFGVALVEALACAQQIVASDCPHGPAEILGNGQWGQLVTPGDPAALAAGILRSLRGEVRFAPESLRQRAAEFSADRSISEYQEMLTRLAPHPR